MEFLHHLLSQLVGVAILLFEYAGTIILLVTGIRSIYGYVRHIPNVKLELGKGLAMGLEFKLGSEILKTVIVNDISELYILGGIIVLRAALTFLIHWEIQVDSPHEKKLD